MPTVDPEGPFPVVGADSLRTLELRFPYGSRSRGSSDSGAVNGARTGVAAAVCVGVGTGTDTGAADDDVDVGSLLDLEDSSVGASRGRWLSDRAS